MNRKRSLGLQKVTRRVLILTMVACLLLLMVLEAGAAGLWDMRGHWAEEDVLLLLEEGIISGYPDQSFRPDQGLSRAEFACFMNRSFGLNETGEPQGYLPDPDKWYARDMALAVKAGYLVGYEDGSFRPEALISRQEAAVILARLLQLDVQNAHLANLRGIEEIPSWSRSSIAALLSAGYIHGYEDGTFRPATIISRAEVAVILANKKRLAEQAAVELIALEPDQTNASQSSGHRSHQTSTPADRQALLAMIARAQSRSGQVIAGREPGQFPAQAMTSLQNSIKQAIHISKTASSQTEINQAVSRLEAALQTFNDQEIGPGGDSNILRSVFEVSR